MLYLLMKGAKEEGHDIHSHVPVSFGCRLYINTRRNNSRATPEYNGKINCSKKIVEDVFTKLLLVKTCDKK
jgi:hypothetical protein